MARNKKKKKNKEEGEYEEPKIRWQKSEAKRLLEKDIHSGNVPLYATDANGQSTMKLEDIYYSRVEFTEYLYSKFSSRLSSLRNTVKKDTSRAALDQEAFESYKQNHPALAYFSHKGYIQWQGSEAQRLCLEDLKEKRHENVSRKDFFGSRPEYYENFPLDVFRDKVNQEIRTAKYLHTLEVKGKDARKEKKK